MLDPNNKDSKDLPLTIRQGLQQHRCSLHFAVYCDHICRAGLLLVSIPSVQHLHLLCNLDSLTEGSLLTAGQSALPSQVNILKLSCSVLPAGLSSSLALTRS